MMMNKKYSIRFIVLKISMLFLFSLNVLAENNDQNTLIVATHIEPPLVNIINGTFTGQNVEVAKMLANAIGKKVTFLYCPFARCLNMTRDGKADMMIAINKTVKREKFLDYLDQPFSSKITPVRFYIKSERKLTINNYDDLQGLTIGVLRGATYFKRFDNDPHINKVEITTHRQLIDMLLKGRIDSFLGRELSIRNRVDERTYTNKMRMAPYTYNKRNDYYIAISKKSSDKLNIKQLSHSLDNLISDGSINAVLTHL